MGFFDNLGGPFSGASNVREGNLGDRIWAGSQVVAAHGAVQGQQTLDLLQRGDRGGIGRAMGANPLSPSDHVLVDGAARGFVTDELLKRF